MNPRWRTRLAEILEPGEKSDPLSLGVDGFIITLIALNVGAVILESVDALAAAYSGYFYQFEVFSVAVFTLEYLLRLGVCVELPEYRGPVLGRLRYMVTPLALIDLLAILPFYLHMLIPLDLRFLRMLRLLRFFRLFKMVRYLESMQLLGTVVRRKKEELVLTFLVSGILLVLASSLIYFMEHEAQPQVFSSIPAAMWWGVATMTTVGYGDVYPVTPAGKLFGGFIAVLGLGMFALPAGLLASGFVDEIQNRNRGSGKCPHCGEDLEPG